MAGDQRPLATLTSPRQDFVVGLGANLGEPEAQLRRAVEKVRALAHTELLACSPLYRSAALGPPQPDYLNGAVRIRSGMAPLALLDALLEIEEGEGRIRTLRWGPRTLDLDILWAEQMCSVPRLHIPHLRLRERWWALRPLLDVAPELSGEYGPTLSGLGPVQIPVLML